MFSIPRRRHARLAFPIAVVGLLHANDRDGAFVADDLPTRSHGFDPDGFRALNAAMHAGIVPPRARRSAGEGSP